MRYSTSIPLALALGAANASITGAPTNTKILIVTHSSGFLTYTNASMTATVATSTAALNTTGWRQVQTGHLMPTFTASQDEEQPYPDDQLGHTWDWSTTVTGAPSPIPEVTQTSSGVQQMAETTTSAPLATLSSPSDDNRSIIGPWKTPGNGLNFTFEGLELEVDDDDTEDRTPFSDTPGPVIPDEDNFEEPSISEGDEEELIEQLIRDGLSRKQAEMINALLKLVPRESRAMEEDSRKTKAAINSLAKDFRRLRQMAKFN
ncbi:hypothetical protein PspLS_11733 [Pyricularia sp. CBS 133598]|nr:hypothetical protein PspLS_11733 [Pyricularia sp. CBS 133598]